MDQATSTTAVVGMGTMVAAMGAMVAVSMLPITLMMLCSVHRSFRYDPLDTLA